MQHLVHSGCGERAVHGGGEAVDARFHQALQGAADHVEGEVEHQRHNEDERRYRGELAGEDAVQLFAAAALLALYRFFYRRSAYVVDKTETHIRDGGAAVQPAFGLHLQDDMLDHLFFILLQLQLVDDQRVALDHLVGGKAHRQPRAAGVVLDQVADGVDAAVHRASVLRFVAEILPQGLFLIVRHVQRVVDQLLHAFVLGGGDRYHRHAQERLHLVYVHGAAVVGHFVHHVQRHNHGRVHFEQLHGEVQVALDVRGVRNVDDGARLFADHEIARYDLFARVGAHAVDARQVGHAGVGVPADGAVLAVDRYARKVSHVLVCAGQLVEQRGLAAILVAHQRKGERFVVRQRVAAALGVVFASLAETGVLCGAHRFLCENGRFFGGLCRRNADLTGVVQPQRELVAVDLQLHRVAHRRVFYQRHHGARYHAHIQKMLPQRSRAADGRDHRAFADLKFF